MVLAIILKFWYDFPAHAEGVYATLPFTERGMPIVINGDPKGNNFLYCNGNAVVIRDINVSQGVEFWLPGNE